MIDYCAASDDLRADARGLGERGGFQVDGPTEGGRRLPDGTEIRWRVARIRQEGRLLPFLIEDVSLRSLRVPGGSAAEHPNGAAAITSLEIVTPDPRAATRSLEALIGGPDEYLRLGACTLVPVAPGHDTVARSHLDAAGPGPLIVTLATGGPGGGEELDLRCSNGVNIRLLGRTT